jgi:hypothetical protein
VLGLDHVHLTHIALGKTHAVGISRHGHVYTWGLNNMYQCGRIEVHTAPTATPSVHTTGTTLQLCAPNEHLWVDEGLEKHVPSTHYGKMPMFPYGKFSVCVCNGVF